MDHRDHRLALTMLAALGLGGRVGGVVLDRGIPVGRVSRAGGVTRLATLTGRVLATVRREVGAVVIATPDGVILHRFAVR